MREIDRKIAKLISVVLDVYFAQIIMMINAYLEKNVLQNLVSSKTHALPSLNITTFSPPKQSTSCSSISCKLQNILLLHINTNPNQRKAIIIIIIIIVATSLFLSLLASQAEMAFWLEGPQLRGLLHTCLHAAHHHHHHATPPSSSSPHATKTSLRISLRACHG